MQQKLPTIEKLRAQMAPHKVYADHRGPSLGEKRAKEKIQSPVNEFTRKIKGEQEVKH